MDSESLHRTAGSFVYSLHHLSTNHLFMIRGESFLYLVGDFATNSVSNSYRHGHSNYDDIRTYNIHGVKDHRRVTGSSAVRMVLLV